MNTLPKADSAFPWISALPLSEPLLNMHTTFYMSVITYLDTSNPWSKCPKRGLTTTGGQIPIEKHYHSLSPLELEIQVEQQTQVGIPLWIRIQIGIPSWIVNPLGECRVGHEDRWESSTMRPRTRQSCPRAHEAEERDLSYWILLVRRKTSEKSSWVLLRTLWGLNSPHVRPRPRPTEKFNEAWSDERPQKCPREFCWGLYEVATVRMWGRGRGRVKN